MSRGAKAAAVVLVLTILVLALALGHPFDWSGVLRGWHGG